MTLDALIGVAGNFNAQDLLDVHNALCDVNDHAHATKYQEGIVVYLATPYCDENRLVSGWEENKHAMKTLMEMFPKNFVFYAADNFLGGDDQILYNPNREPMTLQRIAKIDNAYREREENEESNSLHNA